MLQLPNKCRLLSEPGIPKLRKLARSGKIGKRLGFKGKGHEFSDVAKLLNYYQLWLDDLFPRAKFADGLIMVEKVGHSKRMQSMRKEWIDEGKPGYRDKAQQEEEAREQEKKDSGHAENTTPDAKDDMGDLFFADPNGPTEKAPQNAPEDDELDALLTEQSAVSKSQHMQADSEGEDDLDALLAEQDSRVKQPVASAQQKAPTVDDDEDELDALLAEQEAGSTGGANPVSTRKIILDEDDEDEDDLDALLAEQEARIEPTSATGPRIPEPTEQDRLESTDMGMNDIENMLSSPLPNNPEETDLADLLSSPLRD
jgi:replication fork protection complex subunit Csm3/Swi3